MRAAPLHPGAFFPRVAAIVYDHSGSFPFVYVASGYVPDARGK
jgi:hypothetical protein